MRELKDDLEMQTGLAVIIDFGIEALKQKDSVVRISRCWSARQ